MAVGTYAVKRNARAHGLASHLRVEKDGRGICHAGRSASAREPPHAGELLLNRCRAIPKIGGFRICKMRDDIHHAHARNGRELVVDGIHFHRQKPQPVHAGIHLDVAAHVLHARLSEKVNLPEGMNDGLDLERLEPLNVGGVKEAFEKQNSLLPAAAACQLGIAEVDGGESVRIGKGRHGIFEPVTVGISLHHCPERTALGLASHYIQIVAKCMEINFSKDWARHDFLELREILQRRNFRTLPPDAPFSLSQRSVSIFAHEKRKRSKWLLTTTELNVC